MGGDDVGEILATIDEDFVSPNSLFSLFQVSREELISEQQADEELKRLYPLVVPETASKDQSSCYFLQHGLLCRRWTLIRHCLRTTFVQIVVPRRFRPAVLELCHD